MRISTKTRYAMRFMAELASHWEQGRTSLKDIAERQGISKRVPGAVRGTARCRRPDTGYPRSRRGLRTFPTARGDYCGGRCGRHRGGPVPAGLSGGRVRLPAAQTMPHPASVVWAGRRDGELSWRYLPSRPASHGADTLLRAGAMPDEEKNPSAKRACAHPQNRDWQTPQNVTPWTLFSYLFCIRDAAKGIHACRIERW